MDEEALKKIEAAYAQAFPDGVEGVEFIGIPEIDAAMKVAQCVPLLVREVRKRDTPPVSKTRRHLFVLAVMFGLIALLLWGWVDEDVQKFCWPLAIVLGVLSLERIDDK